MNTMKKPTDSCEFQNRNANQSPAGKKKQKKQSKAKKHYSKTDFNDKSDLSKTSTLYKHKASSCVSDEEESKYKESPVVQENMLAKEKKSTPLSENEVNILNPDELKFWARVTHYPQEDCRRAVNMLGRKPEDFVDMCEALMCWIKKAADDFDRDFNERYSLYY